MTEKSARFFVFEMLQFSIANLGPPEIRTAMPRMRVILRDQLALPLPLVAYDLPWYSRPAEFSVKVADALESLGIALAGLQQDFSQTSEGETSESSLPPLAICPYLPDRFGLHLNDLRSARVIDVRLTAVRDQRQLPYYESAALRRWDARAAQIADRAEETYGGMQSLHWPPDVADVNKLPAKLQQLRVLAPQATICVTLDAAHLLRDLSAIMSAAPDIIGIRAVDWPVEYAAPLAELICQTTEVLQTRGRETTKLLVVPPDAVDVEDVVKLLALGADMVAIDGWCRSLLASKPQSISNAQWAATTLGVVARDLDRERNEIDLAPLMGKLDHLRLLVQSLGVAEVGQLNRDLLVDFGNTIHGVRGAITNVQR